MVFGGVWIYYLLAPFLFKLIDTFEKAVFAVLVVYIVNPWLNMKFAGMLPIESDPHIYDAYIVTFGPFAQILIFMLGIIMYYGIEKINSEDISKNKLLSYTILIFAAILIYGQINGEPNLYRFSRHEMFGLFFCLILLSQALYQSKLICNPVFSFVGKYSYGIYLFQFICIKSYDKYIHYEGTFAWPIKFCVCTSVLLMISVVLNHFIEKPISRVFHKVKAGK